MNDSCGCSCSIGNKPATGFKTLSPQEFAKAIESPDVIRVDVRTADEFATGHIKDAINIDVNGPDFVEIAKKTLPLDKVIAVNCGTGKRSAKAAGELVEAGYTVINLDGGLNAWKDAGLPIV